LKISQHLAKIWTRVWRIVLWHQLHDLYVQVCENSIIAAFGQAAEKGISLHVAFVQQYPQNTGIMTEPLTYADGKMRKLF